MTRWLTLPFRSTRVYFQQWRNVVDDIEKQDKLLRDYRRGKTRDGVDYSDVENYLQQLVNIHHRLFPASIALIFSLTSLILSIITFFLKH